MTQDEIHDMVSTLETESKFMRARNERLEEELDIAKLQIDHLMFINRHLRMIIERQQSECRHGVDDGACKECYREGTK